MNLGSLTLFLQIVESGSLSAAGREAGLSTTTVSERLAALEEHYGVALLTRSTRSLSLTAEGEALVEGARRLLAEADRVDTSVRHGAREGRDAIRFSAPSDLGENTIMPIVDRFLSTRPDLGVDLKIGDEVVDILRQGLDFAIRDGKGNTDGLTSEHLIRNRRAIVASPEYLARAGTPTHPSDLINHRCLTLSLGGHVNRYWRFQSKGVEVDAPFLPVRTTNNARILGEWCRQGHGIAIKSVLNVAEDLASGRLIEILPEFQPPSGDFHVLYRSGEVPRRAVTELLSEISSELRRLERETS